MCRASFMIVALLMTVGPVGSVHAAANETDTRIESAAQKSYVFKRYLKDDSIQIESKDGLVTLTGTVADESHKLLAQETVANLPGVKSLDNRLKFNDPPAEKSDAWLTTKVKTALLFHRNVSVMTEVTTNDGVVILQGEATSQAQKALATEYASDVEGVKAVNNKMSLPEKTGKPNEKTMGEKLDAVSESVDDASITALVKMTLLYHRSTSAINTSVETKNGRVSLGGEARVAAEKDLVTKYVQDVNGVQSVANNMTIAAPRTK
ncbi:MAG: BON domain-containing protein [Proteobacteria bacterium]|nr:BON domain-containing protein [Pseudomonadota bacterium]MBU1710871.1 BON domain-containing protein [Pseudomonadota bacterium]